MEKAEVRWFSGNRRRSWSDILLEDIDRLFGYIMSAVPL
jgi:hypothetical protein